MMIYGLMKSHWRYNSSVQMIKRSVYPKQGHLFWKTLNLYASHVDHALLKII